MLGRFDAEKHCGPIVKRKWKSIKHGAFSLLTQAMPHGPPRFAGPLPQKDHLPRAFFARLRQNICGREKWSPSNRVSPCWTDPGRGKWEGFLLLDSGLLMFLSCTKKLACSHLRLTSETPGWRFPPREGSLRVRPERSRSADRRFVKTQNPARC